MRPSDSAPSFADLLNETIKLSPAERAERLRLLRDADPDRAAALEAALATATDGGQSDAFDAAAMKLERLGDFRVLSLIGQGGMGAVFLAEQDNPRRNVALKVMRHGGNDHEAARRFRREGAALAMLDHPGIAGEMRFDLLA